MHRELFEGLVERAGRRVSHHLSSKLLIDIDQGAARRQVSGADTKSHQLNILQGETFEITDPGNVILIIVHIFERHNLEHIGKAEVKACAA